MLQINIQGLQDKEAEERALGFIIGYDTKYQDEFFLELTKDDFTVYEYQVLFIMMQEMYQKQKVINIQTVNAERKSFGYTKPSGADIMDFVLKANHSSYIEGVIQIIKGCTLKRQFITNIQQASNDCQRGKDAEEICQELMANLSNILLRTKVEKLISFKQASAQLDELILENMKNGECKNVLKIGNTETLTGLYTLNEKIGGFLNGELCVIGAESGSGKSALGLSIATILGKEGYCGAYYSAEMEAEQLSSRIYSAEMNSDTIYSSTLIKRVITEEEYSLFSKEKKKLENIPLYFDENNRVDINRIVKSIRIMKQRFNIRFAVVDYLQMLYSNEKNQKLLNNELFLAFSVRELKNIAKEEEIVVFLISQLSRDKDNIGLHYNRLRGSGQIMDTASEVLLMEKGEDKPDSKFKEEGYRDEFCQGKALIHIAKNRTGSPNLYDILGFDAPHTRFYSLPDKKENTQQQKEITINADTYKIPSNCMFEKQTEFEKYNSFDESYF